MAAIRRLRQENICSCIGASLRQLDTEFGGFFAQESVGQLNQHARTIAEQRIIAGGTAVRQIFEDLQALLNNRVALLIFDMGDKTDATGIMFIGGVIQTLALRKGHLVFPRHKTNSIKHVLTSIRRTARPYAPGVR